MLQRKTILIIEDELITGENIAELLREEEYDVAGPFKSAAETLAFCEGMSIVPALALCDVNIKGPQNGTQLATQLKEKYGCEIVFITAYSDNDTIKQAYESEPVMYLVKPFTETQLLVSVQIALNKILTREKLFRKHKLHLTAREKEIVLLIAEGLSSKQVADKLSISIETVKTHRSRMLKKNNISNFAQLVYLLHNKESNQ